MKTVIPALICLLLLSISGCDNSSSPNNPAVDMGIEGLVKDTQGNLISDAKVYLIYDYGNFMPKPGNKPAVSSELHSVILDGPYVEIRIEDIKLYWYTYSETDNQYFEIQRKREFDDWAAIGYMNGQGTTTDTTYYEFIDQTVTTGTFYYRLKIIDFNGSFSYSGEIEVRIDPNPIESNLTNPYPNPFEYYTNIRFTLRANSLVTFDLYNFKDELVLDEAYISELDAGYWVITGEFSDTIPSGGYRLVMNISESDTSYNLEKNILQTAQANGPSILNTKENTVTENGVFKIQYNEMPFGVQFVQTGPDDPTPLRLFEIGKKLKLVIYKTGYKVVEKEVTVVLDEEQQIEIQLETE